MIIKSHGLVFVFEPNHLTRVAYISVKELKSFAPARCAHLNERDFLMQVFKNKTAFVTKIVSPEQVDLMKFQAVQNGVALHDHATPTSTLVKKVNQVYSKTEANKFTKAWFDQEKKVYLPRLKKLV